MGARVAAVRRGRRRGARLHVHGATAAAAQIVRWRSSGGRMMALALLVLWFTFLLCVFRLCLCCLSLARDAAVLTACEVCASAEQNGSSGEQNAKNGNEIRNFWTSRVPTPHCCETHSRSAAELAVGRGSGTPARVSRHRSQSPHDVACPTLARRPAAPAPAPAKEPRCVKGCVDGNAFWCD